MIALHISHTDILHDSRILKEMDAIRELDGLTAIGIGIGDTDIHIGDIRAVRNFSRGLPLRLTIPGRPLKMFLLMIVYLRLLLRACTTRAQVVHCHDWFVLPIGTLHSLIWRSKLIYDAHELESDTNTRSILRKRAAFWVERMCWRRIKGFITVSGAILDWYGEMFGPRAHSAVVLNSPAIRTNNRCTDASGKAIDIQSKYGISKDKSLGVYLGGLETGRGLDIILDAVATIPDQTHMLFIGYGSYEQKLRKKAEMIGCTNVTFVGRLPHDTVVHYIDNCDYGVCLIEPVSLSDVYSLPNKLFEYVHAGLHVFGSELPEIRKFLDDTGFGTPIDSTPEALREAIANEAFPKPDKGAKVIPQRFSWPAQGEALRTVYQKIAY